MHQEFSFSQFLQRFPDNEACLEEIKRQRFPDGIRCLICMKPTRYYKLKSRIAYTCKFCRHQVYPLADTIFARTTTPLRFWFYAMFLMTHTKAETTAKQLQRELGVTYKTAWRMSTRIRTIMTANNGDLLHEIDEDYRVRKLIFFNKFEIRVVQKQEILNTKNK